MTAPFRRLAWAVFYLALFAGLYFAARSLPWRSAIAGMASANPLWLAVATAINFAGLPLWATQWRFLAPVEKRGRWRRMFGIVALTGAAQNTYTAVGGAASGVALLVGRGGLSHREALALYAMDQMLNGIGKVAVVVAALSLAPLPFSRGAQLLLVAVGAASVILAAVLLLRRRQLQASPVFSGWLSRAAHYLHSEAAALAPFVQRACGWPLLILALRKLTEIGTALAVQRACGIPLSFEAAILITAATDVAMVIPSTPGSVGVFEAAVLFVYEFLGVPAGLALSAGVLQHAAHLLPAIGSGYAVLLLRFVRTSSAARE